MVATVKMSVSGVKKVLNMIISHVRDVNVTQIGKKVEYKIPIYERGLCIESFEINNDYLIITSRLLGPTKSLSTLYALPPVRTDANLDKAH